MAATWMMYSRARGSFMTSGRLLVVEIIEAGAQDADRERDQHRGDEGARQ